MTKVKSLVDGIGNEAITEKYYDDWALNYDQTLKDWNYKTPLKAADLISKIKDNIGDINITLIEQMENIREDKNEVEIDIDETEIDKSPIPEAEPYIHHPDTEDDKTNPLVAEHRQMDIKLDEISLLENPEVDIFPDKQRTLLLSTITTNKIEREMTSTKLKPKQKEKKIEQKVKIFAVNLKFSFVLSLISLLFV